METIHPIAPDLNRRRQHIKEVTADVLVYLSIASVFAIAVTVLWFISLLFV
ncbi:MAG TPA: hypothetical protein VE224_03940 [Pseudolabrys sp.]|nr:hypothetical protein [Pseudolabrys sp.]